MQNFEEIFKQLQARYSNLEEKSKDARYTILFLSIALFLVFVISFFINIFIALFVLIIAIICVMIYFRVTAIKFNKSFKSTVIADLVNLYDYNLQFNEAYSIKESQYANAEFERYDNFYSNDLISGNIGGTIYFELGDVRTEVVHEDDEGNVSTSTVFSGIFSVGKLPKFIDSTIKIRSDKGILGKLKRNSELMHMDSQEFEKQFDVYAEDKILAMRILTSDIMDYLINFKLHSKINFEITIKDENIYCRFHCSNMFEGSLFTGALNKPQLQKYYNCLDFMCTLTKKIYSILLEKEL